MRIETNNGQIMFAKTAAAANMRGESRLMITFEAGTTFAEAATAFEGAAWIRTQSDNAAGVTTLYEGYSRLTMISRAENDEVRVTLTREAATDA